MNTIEKLNQLLELAEDFGGKQFREDIVALVIAPRLVRPAPVELDLVYRSGAPAVLTLAWLDDAIRTVERFWCRPVDAIKLSTEQHRQLTDRIFIPPTCPPTKLTHYDGIPLKVIAHCREGGGITG